LKRDYVWPWQFLIAMIIAIIYIWSSVILNKPYSIPLAYIKIPTDTASGERLTHITHCNHFHENKFSGGIVSKTEDIDQMVIPNKTMLMPEYFTYKIVSVPFCRPLIHLISFF